MRDRTAVENRLTDFALKTQVEQRRVFKYAPKSEHESVDCVIEFGNVQYRHVDGMPGYRVKEYVVDAKDGTHYLWQDIYLGKSERAAQRKIQERLNQ